jgi:hypothetical protein
VDALQSQRCGSAESTASSGMAKSLINGVAYNVAVAATDSYENVGKLSETACGVPQPVTGFYCSFKPAPCTVREAVFRCSVNRCSVASHGEF